MATLTEYPTAITTTSVSLPDFNGPYDPDLDAYLNLDQFTYTSSESVKPKPASTSRLSISGFDSSLSDSGSVSYTSSSQSQISFPGPSHQYDDHPQQTGLPPGGLAHAIAFSGLSSMGLAEEPQDTSMNGDGFSGFGHLKQETQINFGTAPTRNSSDMDLESDNMNPFPGLYLSSNTSNNTQFVNPNALGGHELSPIPQPPPVSRMYPGMHQQQAAMARAAQQQKQHELLRQQKQQQPQQQQQPRRAEEQGQQGGRQQARNTRSVDPVVEERISRLLQQMRQKNVGQEDTAQPATMLPQMSKPRKDEDDMDEDERLLASEEGKKLSSKERRQLRNKVSARAFRSRRKEYISQLEGEVAAKTTETSELRMQNRALLEENARLTDLTRMLLSSPHFSAFLNDFAVNGLPHRPQEPQSQPHPQSQLQIPSQQPPVASPAPMRPGNHSDMNPSPGAHEFHVPQNFHVGMAVVPEQHSDMTAMDAHESGWNSGIDMGYNNVPVFAVLEVPVGPTIDADILSSKECGPGFPTLEMAKDGAPCLDLPPTPEIQPERKASFPECSPKIESSDLSIDLFTDEPSTVFQLSQDPFVDLFGGIELDKVFAHYELVIKDESTEISAATMHRFERLCHTMEAAFQRVSRVTSYL